MEFFLFCIALIIFLGLPTQTRFTSFIAWVTHIKTSPVNVTVGDALQFLLIAIHIPMVLPAVFFIFLLFEVATFMATGIYRGFVV
jgi:hypothetical protein